MNKNLIALAAVALAVCGATAAFWFVSTGDREPARATADSGAADKSAPGELGEVAPLDSAKTSSTSDSASARAAAERTDLVWIEGTVAIPSGTPADEALEVWAFGTNSDPVRRAQDISRAAVIAGEREDVLARCDVDSSGAFRCPVPSERESIWLVLAGRYNACASGVFIDLTKDLTPVRFEPELGAWITGRIALPVGVADDAFDRKADEIELELDALGMSGAGALTGIGDARSRNAHCADTLEFELRGVTAKRSYRAVLKPKRLAAVRSAPFKTAPGEHVVLELAPRAGGTLTGSVRDPSGAPIAKAKLEVSIEPLAFNQGGFEVRDATSAEDGTFKLDAVAPGDLRVHVEAAGFLENRREARLDDLQTIQGFDVVLDKGSTIGGRVTWPDGRAAVDVKVDVGFDATQLGGMGAFNAMRGADGSARTTGDGRFEVTGLGKGPFTVKCTHTEQTVAAAVPAHDHAGGGKSSGDAEPADGAGLVFEAPDAVAPPEKVWRARADHVKPNTLDLELVLSPPLGLAGRVVDRDGQPVVKFSIAGRTASEGLIPGLGGESARDSFEADDGTFLLEGMSNGAWDIVASAEGFAPSAKQSVTMPRAADAAPLEFVLERVATVRGSVLTKAGAPAPGAQVKLKQELADFMRSQMEQREAPKTKAGADGRFELTGLSPGNAALVAATDESAESEAVVVELAAGATVEDVVLRLREGGTITGEVYGDGGKPISGAAVMANTAADPLGQRWSTADGAGRFEFLHVPEGSWNVIYMPSDSKAMRAAGEGGGEADGNDAAIALFAEMKMTIARVKESETTHVVLGAPPRNPVRVHGRTQVAGEGVGGLIISFIRDGGAALEQMMFTTSASDGAYSLELKEPGGYLLTVQRTGGSGEQQSWSTYLRVPDQPDFAHDIDLPVASISGRVTDSDGAAAKNVRVSLVRDGGIPSSALFGDQFAEISTDDNGRYELVWLRPGSYTVGAGGQAFGGIYGAEQSAPPRVMKSGLNVAEGERLTDVDFKLGKAGSIRGLVRDAAGQPLGGAALFTRDAEGRLLERLSMVQSDATGRFELHGLSPGDYTMIARTGALVSHQPVAVTVNAGAASDVELSVAQGTMLLISLVNSKGDDVDCSLEVLDEHDRQVNGMLSLDQITRAFSEGDFSTREQEVGPLAPGKYKVTATADDGRKVTKPVNLGGLPERRLRLEL